jgi:Flp pilus assembly protein TadB
MALSSTFSHAGRYKTKLANLRFHIPRRLNCSRCLSDVKTMVSRRTTRPSPTRSQSVLAVTPLLLPLALHALPLLAALILVVNLLLLPLHALPHLVVLLVPPLLRVLRQRQIHRRRRRRLKLRIPLPKILGPRIAMIRFMYGRSTLGLKRTRRC